MVIKKQVCNRVSSLFKYNHFKLKVQSKFLSIQSCQPEPTAYASDSELLSSPLMILSKTVENVHCSSTR